MSVQQLEYDNSTVKTPRRSFGVTDLALQITSWFT